MVTLEDLLSIRALLKFAGGCLQPVSSSGLNPCLVTTTLLFFARLLRVLVTDHSPALRPEDPANETTLGDQQRDILKFDCPRFRVEAVHHEDEGCVPPRQHRFVAAGGLEPNMVKGRQIMFA